MFSARPCRSDLHFSKAKGHITKYSGQEQNVLLLFSHFVTDQIKKIVLIALSQQNQCEVSMLGYRQWLSLAL